MKTDHSDPTQTIFRVAHRKRPYAQISNAMLRDRRLSMEARGALGMILTNRPDWKIPPKWLCENAGWGKDKALKVLNEMIDLGYCRRHQVRSADGTMGANEYHFTDEPFDFEETPGNKGPESQPENPAPVNPAPALPATVQPAPVNQSHKNNSNKGNNSPLPPSGVSPKGERGSRLPDDFVVPDEWRAWAIGEAPKFEAIVHHEAAKFVDWARAEGKRKKDWFATWRNWWRRSVEQAPRTFGLLPTARDRHAEEVRKSREIAARLEEAYR